MALLIFAGVCGGRPGVVWAAPELPGALRPSADSARVDAMDPPIAPEGTVDATNAWWSSWEPAPSFGPGSDRPGGVVLWRGKVAATRLQIRLGLDDETTDQRKLLAEAQRQFNQPIVRSPQFTTPEEDAEEGGLAHLATGLLQWQRIFYLVVFFD